VRQTVKLRDRLMRVIRAEAGHAGSSKVHPGSLNEVLTQTLQDSTLIQATRPVLRNRQARLCGDPDRVFVAVIRKARITDLTFCPPHHTFAGQPIMAEAILVMGKRW